MASRHKLGALLGLVLVVGCSTADTDKAGGGRRPPTLTLTLANGLQGPDELTGFIHEVARLSGGTIRVEVRGSWRAGQPDSETGLIRDVRAGRADLGWTGSRAWESVGVLALRALHAPLLIDTPALQEQVLRSPLIPEMVRSLDGAGVVGIGVLPGPMRKPLGVTRPLVGPSDYAGLRIGVSASTVADETMRALGARPVTVPFGGPVDGLDGIEQQVASISGNHYDAVGRSLTANVSLWPRPLVLFANRSRFDSLSPLQRDVLRQAALNAIAGQTATERKDESEAAAALCRRGLTFVTATPQEVDALRRAVQPVYRMLRQDRQTAGFLAQIAVLRAHASASAEPPLSCAPAAAGTATDHPTPVDGVYRVTTTAQELLASGSRDARAENYGTWTYVFDRGRFAFTQENTAACTWGYGSFAVKGNTIEWTFRDGGGIAPNGAVNSAGEFFVFGWSLYRERLDLTPVEGAVSPENFRVKPWDRIGGTPSAGHLSRRCPPPAGALPSHR